MISNASLGLAHIIYNIIKDNKVCRVNIGHIAGTNNLAPSISNCKQETER
jgi:hypothetical protein